MKGLRNYIEEFSKEGKAIGHFNFATAEMLRGIVEGAKESGAPVVVGLSEGERDFFGLKEARAIVSAFAEDFDLPIFLNADHTKSFERSKEAIDCGFDSLVVDGSGMSFAKNVEMVKMVSDYARKSGRDVIIEGELGFIGASSQILEELPPGVPVDESKMTSPEEARKFVLESGADLIAPAVGNVHGVIRQSGNPPISINRIRDIRNISGVPVVLHGASGISEAEIRKVAPAGAVIVHFSTDLRIVFRRSLSSALSTDPDEVSPYKYMRDAIKAVKETVKTKISWLNST